MNACLLQSEQSCPPNGLSGLLLVFGIDCSCRARMRGTPFSNALH